jgi:CRP/FNR family transcriptional regulator, cyclic AMP receptor protein
MIGQDQFKRIAIRSRELSEREIKAARAGITERSYVANETIFARGDQFDY